MESYNEGVLNVAHFVFVVVVCPKKVSGVSGY